MSDSITIDAPGGFAPAYALGHDDGGGRLTLVGASSPLPVTLAAAPQPTSPLQGSTAGPILAGPFIPALLSPIYLVLSGSWTGTARLLRSTDSGATLHPLTVGGGDWGLYTGNACEIAWEESEHDAALWLDLAPISGMIAYRVSQ